MGSRTSSRHIGADVFAATGEQRQLFARDVAAPPNRPLVRIEVGEARELRTRARNGDLVCPIPGCADPRFTTSGGSRRDHFVHRSAPSGGHGPETILHHAAKWLIGGWLCTNYPEARVVVDGEAVENGQVPDVFAVMPDGRRFAFEVQYAALTVQEWRHRHEGYQNLGIRDVWLLGSTPRYFKPDAADRTKLVPLAAALWMAGEGPYWISPDEKSVATAVWWTDRESRGDGSGESAPRDVAVGIDLLDRCSLEAVGFQTPTDRELHAARLRFEQEEAKQRLERQEAARRETEAASARQQQLQASADAARARFKAETEARNAVDKAKNALSRTNWLAYQTRLGRSRSFESVKPILEIELAHDSGVRLSHEEWHARFFLDRIQGHVGETFSFVQACLPLLDSGESDGRVFDAVQGFLVHLRSYGFVALGASRSSFGDDILVIADADPGEAGVR